MRQINTSFVTKLKKMAKQARQEIAAFKDRHFFRLWDELVKGDYTNVDEFVELLWEICPPAEINRIAFFSLPVEPKPNLKSPVRLEVEQRISSLNVKKAELEYLVGPYVKERSVQLQASLGLYRSELCQLGFIENFLGLVYFAYFRDFAAAKAQFTKVLETDLAGGDYLCGAAYALYNLGILHRYLANLNVNAESHHVQSHDFFTRAFALVKNRLLHPYTLPSLYYGFAESSYRQAAKVFTKPIHELYSHAARSSNLHPGVMLRLGDVAAQQFYERRRIEDGSMALQWYWRAADAHYLKGLLAFIRLLSLHPEMPHPVQERSHFDRALQASVPAYDKYRAIQPQLEGDLAAEIFFADLFLLGDLYSWPARLENPAELLSQLFYLYSVLGLPEQFSAKTLSLLEGYGKAALAMLAETDGALLKKIQVMPELTRTIFNDSSESEAFFSDLGRKAQEKFDANVEALNLKEILGESSSLFSEPGESRRAMP